MKSKPLERPFFAAVLAILKAWDALPYDGLRGMPPAWVIGPPLAQFHLARFTLAGVVARDETTQRELDDRLRILKRRHRKQLTEKRSKIIVRLDFTTAEQN